MSRNYGIIPPIQPQLLQDMDDSLPEIEGKLRFLASRKGIDIP